jgi:hypothetical protein
MKENPVRTYRIATTAELESGTRDEVFDIEADDFQISNRGGVRVVRWHQTPPPGFVARLLTIFRPACQNLAWVPHDALLSIRLLPEPEQPEEPPGATRRTAFASGGVIPVPGRHGA